MRLAFLSRNPVFCLAAAAIYFLANSSDGLAERPELPNPMTLKSCTAFHKQYDIWFSSHVTSKLVKCDTRIPTHKWVIVGGCAKSLEKVPKNCAPSLAHFYCETKLRREAKNKCKAETKSVSGPSAKYNTPAKKKSTGKANPIVSFKDESPAMKLNQRQAERKNETKVRKLRPNIRTESFYKKENPEFLEADARRKNPNLGTKVNDGYYNREEHLERELGINEAAEPERYSRANGFFIPGPAFDEPTHFPEAAIPGLNLYPLNTGDNMVVIYYCNARGGSPDRRYCPCDELCSAGPPISGTYSLYGDPNDIVWKIEYLR